ncbi:hypothetical protein F5146DRAFT_1122359 [Armillaria mellea]|nr:hypothetical protein F5146DRAFT_1122359 [Armillaria mellea]
MYEPLDGTAPDPNDVYFPGASYSLYPVKTPDVPEGDEWCEHNEQSLQRQRTAGVYALCLADRIHLPPSPSLTITLYQRLCGRIREHVTHVWIATSPNATVVTKFYGPLYFRDAYDNTDRLRLAAWSAASEVRVYEKLQSLQGTCIPRCLGLYATALPEQEDRTVYVLLLEYVIGKDLQYLCEKHCDAIFSTVFRLAMDFIELGVSQSNFPAL